MVPCHKPVGWLLVLLLVAAACSRTGQDAATEPTATTDPSIVGEVAATFATYRAGVVQGDASAVVESLDVASLDEMARVADIALTADEETVRDLPAADQLLVLTYRLRPELLQAEDPYQALVGAGLAGQDRSLGDLGQVTSVDEDVAVGEVVDSVSGDPTPLRWRFQREDGRWRFDLIDAHRLLSQAIATGADRAGLGVDELVAATVVDLSGEDRATVEELYTERPG